MEIPSGGSDPVAAVVGGIGNTGFDDLVVANHDGDSVSFFEGGPDGLQAIGTQSSPAAYSRRTWC